MKALKTIFIICLIHNACFAQVNSNGNKAIAMLKDFYTAHEKIESSIRTLPPRVYVRESDSLKARYCTVALRNKVKRYDLNGIDFLTDDKGIDSLSLKTMKVTADALHKNTFVVSYDFFDKNYPKTPYVRHVVLHVGLVEEGENYKMASVDGDN